MSTDRDRPGQVAQWAGVSLLVSFAVLIVLLVVKVGVVLFS